MRFPLSMHKAEGRQIVSVTAKSAEQEAELAERGFSPKVPVIPEEAPAPPVEHRGQTAEAIASLGVGLAELGAQISALDTRIEKLEQQKRGPGRPPREESR